MTRVPCSRVWIDVGAHRGELTLASALADPQLTVYAFEPTTALAAQLACRAPNYIVLPAAVSVQDGVAEFFLNNNDETNSLLPFDREALERWIGGETHWTLQRTLVPTLRLDTFLGQMAIRSVEFLKIDAQGHDLAVLQSLGARLRDVGRIRVEVPVGDARQYAGNHSKSDVVGLLASQGFALTVVELQTADQEENLTFERL